MAQTEAPLSVSDKIEWRAASMVRPIAFVGSAAGAAIEQWRDNPTEWGQGGAGYGRRYGSAHGWIVTQNIVAMGLDTTLGIDPRFRRSRESGFWPRVKSAMKQTWVAHKDSGEVTFNYSTVGASYGAGLISCAWYPRRIDSVGDGLIRGTIGLGYDMLSNVVLEFWPRKRKP